MLRLITAAAACLLVLASCGSDANEAEQSGDDGQRTADDVWDRGFLSDAVTEDGEPRPLVSDTRIKLLFESDREIAAWGAHCNSYGADVEITADRLVLGEITSTRMGCRDELHEQDEWLADFFGSDPAWRLTDDRLTLTAGETAIEFEGAARSDEADQRSRDQGAELSVPSDVFERSCRSMVRSGAKSSRPTDLVTDLVVGPVTFYSARVFERGDPADFRERRRPPGRWAALKTVTEVEPGVSATVVVPPRYRDSLLLIYDSRRFTDRIGDSSYFRKSAGDPAVRFPACPPPPKGRSHAFNGGFLVREPGCYEIAVVSDDEPAPERATIGFALGGEGCPDDS